MASGLGVLIQQARQRRGLTQTELGARLGVGRRSVTNWEAGDVPTARLAEIGTELGVDFHQVGEVDGEPRWAMTDLQGGQDSATVVETGEHLVDLGDALDGIEDPVQRKAIISAAVAAALEVSARLRAAR